MNPAGILFLVEASDVMTPQNVIAALYVFALAAFLGYQVISRVPPLLHTPLMSATNAISGISLVGSIVIAGGTGPHHARWPRFSALSPWFVRRRT